MNAIADKPSFNPTLVRLRRSASSHSRRGFSRFQSHAGSIEASLPAGRRASPSLRFNPTLVRLRLPFVEALKEALAMVSIPRWFD